MSIIFAVTLIILFICSSFGYIKIRKNKDILRRKLSTFVIFGGFTAFLYAVAVLSININLTYVGYTCLVAFSPWLMISMMTFLAEYANENRMYGYYKKIISILTFIDTLFVMSNIFFHELSSFTKIKMSLFGSAYIVQRSSLLNYHYIYLFLLNFIFLGFLLYIMHKNKGIYRDGYTLMLVSYLTIFISSFICRINKTYFDYSVLFYGFIGISLYYLVYDFVPKKIEKNIKSLIISNINDALYGLDKNNNIVYMNDNAKKLIEYYSIKDPITYYNNIYDEKNLKDKKFVEWDFYRKVHNKENYYTVTYKKMYDDKNLYIGDYIIIHDKTLEVEEFENQKKLISTDWLTGLYNKNYFEVRVKEALENIKEEYYMIVADVRNFKETSELYGEEMADKILSTISSVMKREFKNHKEILYGHIGYDKFVLFMPRKFYEMSGISANIGDVGKKVDNLNVSLCFGIYSVSNKNESVKSMIEHASLAVSLIKDDSNTNVIFYDSNVKNNIIEETKILNSFKSALSNNEFVFYIQPQISKKGNILGGESLVRWIRDGNVVSPAKFIPLLEKNGLVSDLDRYIWESVCKKLREWQDNNIDLYLSINISTLDFYSMDIYECLTILVEKYSINPKKLKLEITESVFATNLKDFARIIKKLQEYGFIIEMDDFGSGYSSLNMLKNIDIDVIKMDMMFLDSKGSLNKSRIILKSLIELSKKLNLEVITEGVETKNQFEYLKKVGCDVFQGYYFDKPIDIDSFESKYIK